MPSEPVMFYQLKSKIIYIDSIKTRNDTYTNILYASSADVKFMNNNFELLF